MLLVLRERLPAGITSPEPIRACDLADTLGVGERQARRELQRLSRAGFLKLENTGRGFRVQLLPSDPDRACHSREAREEKK